MVGADQVADAGIDILDDQDHVGGDAGDVLPDNKGIGRRAGAGNAGDLEAAELVAEGDAVDAHRLGFAPGREKKCKYYTDCDQSRPERGNHSGHY